MPEPVLPFDTNLRFGRYVDTYGVSPIRMMDAVLSTERRLKPPSEWADPFVPEVDTEHDAQWWRDYYEALRGLEE